jgi:hypothetical protein
VETEVGTFDVEYEQRAAELGSLGRRQMRDV